MKQLSRDSLGRHLVWLVHFTGVDNEGQEGEETSKKPQGEPRSSDS